MPSPPFWPRVQSYYQRKSSSLLFKRSFEIRPREPLISFSFDDFPRSALLTGGSILERFGLAGTYYASFGLIGKDSPSGPVFLPTDLRALVERGHELGCHTFSHCHSWETRPSEYETSTIENRQALQRLLPGEEFKTFSYPISPPRPLSKARIAKHFRCCRGGGQTFNSGVADLNQLSAFFLEKSRDNLGIVRDLINRNKSARGWLIFATHDVLRSPRSFRMHAAVLRRGYSI